MKLLVVDDERIARSELKFRIKEVDPSAVVFEADGEESALEMISNMEFDGAFLDVRLSESSGVILAKKIRLLKPDLPIVFATAYDKYAIDAFALKAIDYILKPFRSEDIARALGRFTPSQTKALLPICPADKLSVWMGEKAVVVNINDIYFLKSSDRQTLLITKNGELSTSQSLDTMEKRLIACGFLRVQRGYIINLNHVAEIIPWFNNTYGVKLANNIGDVIPVSRQKIAILRGIFDF